MRITKPRTLSWTYHSRFKMRSYGLSEARVRRILHAPAWIEAGIAPGTVAFMQKAGSAKHPHELWTMVRDKGGERLVISAWRYPGVSKARSTAIAEMFRTELRDYAAKEEQKDSRKTAAAARWGKSRWFKPRRSGWDNKAGNAA